jgi:predicted MPP superfamily phosphohydrolase
MNEEKKKHPIIKFIIIFILIIAAILLYSRFIATKGLVTKEYKITSSSIQDNFHGFKIVHISDVHYGRTTDKKDLNNMVKEVNLLKPDIVVLTGDLIDRDTKLDDNLKGEISEALSSINANVGKYAISGNHDSNFSEWESIINDSGFKNLNDTYELIYNDGYTPILLAGLSSNLNNQVDITERYNKILEYSNNENIKELYKILLIHEPDYINNIDYSNFNLILAGHSHNGQVRLPFIGGIILPNGAKKYYKEHYKINNTDLYISSGIGTSGISFRLFNKPSINFYRLTNK